MKVPPVSHPFFERHRATLDRAVEAIGESRLLDAVSRVAEPEGLWRRRRRSRQGEVRRAAQPPLSADAAGDDRPGRQRAVAVRHPRSASPIRKPDIDGLMAGVEARGSRDGARPVPKRGSASASRSSTASTRRASRSRTRSCTRPARRSSWRSRPAARMRRTAGSKRSPMRGTRCGACPRRRMWEKPQGKNEPVRMEKRFRIVPRGVALVIGCSTFPTWNGYPGFFAEPRHRQRGRSSSRIRTRSCRSRSPCGSRAKCWPKAGFDPNVVTLVAHEAGDNTAQTLALRPEVKHHRLHRQHGERQLARGARAPGAGLHGKGRRQPDRSSTRPPTSRGVARNLAFSLALYTGQMCTAPQNIYVPKDGIDTADGPPVVRPGRGRRSREGVQKLLADPARAVEVLGAVVERRRAAAARGGALAGRRSCSTRRRSRIRSSPRRRFARRSSSSSSTADRATYLNEWFGPIAFVIATDGTAESLAIARDAVVGHGALTLSVYSTRDDVIERAIDVAEDAGVALSINLTGGVFVNQSAAFSDFHGTGANPAANAALTDAAYRREPFPRRAASRTRLAAMRMTYEAASCFESRRRHRAHHAEPPRPAQQLHDADARRSCATRSRGSRRAAIARVLLLTGAGRGFCAGQDLSDRAVAPGGAPVDLGASIERQLPAAGARLARPAVAGRVRGQRRRRRRGREHRARLRHRDRRANRRASSRRSARSASFPIPAARTSCRASSAPRARWASRCWATSCPPSRRRSGGSSGNASTTTDLAPTVDAAARATGAGADRAAWRRSSVRCTRRPTTRSSSSSTSSAMLQRELGLQRRLSRRRRRIPRRSARRASPGAESLTTMRRRIAARRDRCRHRRGAMGAGIAQIAAQAGHRVRLFDTRMGCGGEGAQRRSARRLHGLAAKGRIDAADARVEQRAHRRRRMRSAIASARSSSSRRSSRIWPTKRDRCCASSRRSSRRRRSSRPTRRRCRSRRSPPG